MPIPPIPAFVSINGTACGAPAVPLESPDLIALLNEASSEDLKAITNRLKVASVWNTEFFAALNEEVFDILPIEEVTTIFQKWLPRLFSEIAFSGEVNLQTSGPCGVSIQFTPPNQVHIVITLTPECLPQQGGAEVNTQWTTLTDRVCADTSDGPQSLPVAYLVDAVSGVSQSQFFQVILDKLNRLLRCCNPCEASPLISIGNITGSGEYTVEGAEAGMVLAQLNFHVIETTVPVDTFLLKPTVRKLGKFAWIVQEGGGTDKLDWVNWDFETRIPPDGYQVVGFAYNLDFGVTLNFEVSTRPGWNLK